NASTPTSTTVTANPVSPVTAGTSVTFTADETPATAGRVQFMDGANALGASVAVDANGMATLTTNTLAAASHSITAVFTPSGTGFTGSTSPALAYVVNPAAATPTTTGLAV